jgi:hypothetical protein
VRFDEGKYWPMVGGALAAVGQVADGQEGTDAVVASARGRGWQWPFSVASGGQALLVSEA